VTCRSIDRVVCYYSATYVCFPLHLLSSFYNKKTQSKYLSSISQQTINRSVNHLTKQELGLRHVACKSFFGIYFFPRKQRSYKKATCKTKMSSIMYFYRTTYMHSAVYSIASDMSVRLIVSAVIVSKRLNQSSA